MIRFLNRLVRRLWLRKILCEDSSLYLERFRLRGWLPDPSLSPKDESGARYWRAPPTHQKDKGTSLYLHRFCLPDADRAPHNHPCAWAVALVLVGGYTEERLVNGRLVRRRLYPGMLNVIRHSDYHTVVELHGRETWTLFLMGRRVSSWGFWVDGKHVEWRERLRERGLTPDY